MANHETPTGWTRTSMVSFTVRMRFPSDEMGRVREMLEPLALASRKEPGCITYVPHIVDGEPSTVLIYEQYRDEAAAEFHRSTPHFKQYAVGGFYQLMLERKVEDLMAIC